VENADKKESLLWEIKEAIKVEGPEFTRFLEMVASFADDIPEEHKRYRASIKALKQSSDVDQYDVLKAADRQLKRLTQTESMMNSSLAEKRADLKQLISRASAINEKLVALSKQVDELEKERTIISERRATRESEINVAEESYKSVADKLAKQISQVKEKIQKYLSDDYQGEAVVEALVVDEPLATQVDTYTSNPMSGFDDSSGGGEAPVVDSPLDAQAAGVSSPMGNGGVNGAGKAPSSTRQKVCPACSGTMDWYAMMKMWKCYSCGHEEKVKKK